MGTKSPELRRNGTDAQKNSVCRAGKPEKLKAAGNRKLVGTCIYKLQRASEREAGAVLEALS